MASTMSSSIHVFTMAKRRNPPSASASATGWPRSVGPMLSVGTSKRPRGRLASRTPQPRKAHRAHRSSGASGREGGHIRLPSAVRSRLAGPPRPGRLQGCRFVPPAHRPEVRPGDRRLARRELVRNGVDLAPPLAVDGIEGAAPSKEAVEAGGAVQGRPRRTRPTREFQLGAGEALVAILEVVRHDRSVGLDQDLRAVARCGAVVAQQEVTVPVESAARDASNGLVGTAATAPARTRSREAGSRSGGSPRGTRASRRGSD